MVSFSNAFFAFSVNSDLLKPKNITRSLPCGTPYSAAFNTFAGTTKYPSLHTDEKSFSMISLTSFKFVRPFTFSAINILGCVIEITSLIHIYKCPLFSIVGSSSCFFLPLCPVSELRPSLLPAIEKSWHGNPPVTISMFFGKTDNLFSFSSFTRSTILSKKYADISTPFEPK